MKKLSKEKFRLPPASRTAVGIYKLFEVGVFSSHRNDKAANTTQTKFNNPKYDNNHFCQERAES